MEIFLQGLIGSLVIYLLVVLPKRAYQKRIEKHQAEKIKEERKRYNSEEEYEEALKEKEKLKSALRDKSSIQAEKAQKKALKFLAVVLGGFILFLTLYLWLR